MQQLEPGRSSQRLYLMFEPEDYSEGGRRLQALTTARLISGLSTSPQNEHDRL